MPTTIPTESGTSDSAALSGEKPSPTCQKSDGTSMMPAKAAKKPAATAMLDVNARLRMRLTWTSAGRAGRRRS